MASVRPQNAPRWESPLLAANRGAPVGNPTGATPCYFQPPPIVISFSIVGGAPPPSIATELQSRPPAEPIPEATMDIYFQRAISNVIHHGDTDIFPFPIENHLFFDKPVETVSLFG